MLIFKQRLFWNTPPISSGEGLGGAAWRVAVYFWKPGFIHVTLHRNDHETLHAYLRRHYEKVSQQRARQFAEQGETAIELDVVFDTPPAEVSGC